jgi:hypothetical protein
LITFATRYFLLAKRRSSPHTAQASRLSSNYKSLRSAALTAINRRKKNNQYIVYIDYFNQYTTSFDNLTRSSDAAAPVNVSADSIANRIA